MEQFSIDLGSLTGDGKVRNLSGHEKGSAARAKYRLDLADASTLPVPVVVPSYVYAISSSFVQGMFTPSLRALGSIEAFFQHYQFDASASIIRQIERGLATKRLVAA